MSVFVQPRIYDNAYNTIERHMLLQRLGRFWLLGARLLGARSQRLALALHLCERRPSCRRRDSRPPNILELGRTGGDKERDPSSRHNES